MTSPASPHDFPAAQPASGAQHLRNLADVGRRWAGDDGSPDPAVRSLLAQVSDADSYLRAVAGLCLARLLMPIVATGDESMAGPDPDRHAEMAAVSLRGVDGRTALLAFTGLDSLQAWDRQARPVPGTLDDVAATVQEAGAEALVIDVAGPTPLEIGVDVVNELAKGRRLVEVQPSQFGWLEVASDQPS